MLVGAVGKEKHHAYEENENNDPVGNVFHEVCFACRIIHTACRDFRATSAAFSAIRIFFSLASAASAATFKMAEGGFCNKL